jgi:D-xylose transport system substrate-binding protein
LARACRSVSTWRKKSGNVIYINGDLTDNNATLFKEGYAGVWKPFFDAGTYKLVGEQTGKWDETVAGTAFDQLYTQNGGKIDGVLSANDTMAKGIIARLKAVKQNGKVPVTGQDATVEGLQSILAGDQCMTVYKPIKVEADAASALAIALIQGKDASALATGKVMDTEMKKEVPSALGTPISITKANVKQVIDDGYQTKEKVCTGAFAAMCTAAGIS